MKSSLSERDGNEDGKGTAETVSDMNCWGQAVKAMSFTACPKKGDGTKIELERKIVRGHIKLFILQMNLERCKQPKNAAMTENVCFGTCRDIASSMQRIFLPSLKVR